MKVIRCLFSVIGLMSLTAHAEITSLDTFGRLPVLEGGRVMPMDSFARLRLLQFSGKSTFDKKPALDWLARLVFTPETSHDSKIFLVNNPEVLEAMDIAAGHERRFSFHDLEPGLSNLNDKAQAALKIEDKERSPVEKEILRVFQNLNAYVELFHSFSFAAPDSEFAVTNPAIRAKLELPDDATSFSYLDIFSKARLMAKDVEAASKLDPKKWSEEQSGLFEISTKLFQWSQFYRGIPIPMIPLRGHGEDQWLAPWDVLSLGFAGEEIRDELGWLQDISRAYIAGRQVDFDLAAHSFERSVLKRAPASRSLKHIDLELMYNRLDLFYRAEIFYGFAFLASLVFLLADRKWMRLAALALVILAFVPHTAGLVSRMVMMGRPPVTNLYATFIFVSWICVVLGLVLEAFQRNGLGTLLSGVAGLVLLMVSGRFSGQGDTLGVMIAVLDSNFWLSTHVVSITIGYAGCVAAGLAGHIYLLKALRHEPDSVALKSAARAVYGLLAFGLIFSFLGTMLGGVWADQSWGRFWGWDPKENGALLIVLWCSLLFHARVSKLIGPLGLAAGSVLGVIVVLMAWLGINLLGVGLHSYGFTSGLARGLWISVAVEILFVAATVPFAKKSVLQSTM